MILESTIPCVMQRISIPNILRLFNAVSLCKQVIIRSKYAGVASACCLALSILCRPLRWEGVLIPVLPESMKTVLSAPIPYIIGICGHDIKLDPSEVQVDGLVCDVDVDKVYVMNKYPALPAWPQLYNNIKAVCSKIFPKVASAHTLRNAFDPLPEQKGISGQIFVCFKSYTGWLTGKVSEHFKNTVPPPKNLKELRLSFLPTVTAQNREFVEGFLSSQNFAVWCESQFFIK